jgi:hypothetical protein
MAFLLPVTDIITTDRSICFDGLFFQFVTEKIASSARDLILISFRSHILVGLVGPLIRHSRNSFKIGGIPTSPSRISFTDKFMGRAFLGCLIIIFRRIDAASLIYKRKNHYSSQTYLRLHKSQKTLT